MTPPPATDPPSANTARPSDAWPSPLPDPLPLFPLRTVLFPDGQLALRVFEARYLDLVAHCLRRGEGFGVICLRQGAEAGPPADTVALETVGVLARLDNVEPEQAGILQVQCRGHQRFRLTQAPRQQGNGLWVASAQALADDALRLPGPAMLGTVQALAEAIRKLQEQDRLPFYPPFRLDEAGWVANRWAEILPLPLAARQKLMALEDPVIRLSLVDGYLRDKRIVLE